MKTFVYLFPPGLVLSLFIMSSLFGDAALSDYLAINNRIYWVQL